MATLLFVTHLTHGLFRIVITTERRVTFRTPPCGHRQVSLSLLSRLAYRSPLVVAPLRSLSASTLMGGRMDLTLRWCLIQLQNRANILSLVSKRYNYEQTNYEFQNSNLTAPSDSCNPFNMQQMINFTNELALLLTSRILVIPGTCTGRSCKSRNVNSDSRQACKSCKSYYTD